MRFSMELEVTVEAETSDEAEQIVIKALDPITVQCDVSCGPFEVGEPEDEDVEDEPAEGV